MMKATRALLRAGTDAHYENAVYYDHAYRSRRHDVAFYVDRAVESGGPVLELGAGTGRVTLAIARRGVPVVGVDRMATMLGRARDRASRLPARARQLVTFERGDVMRLRLGRRFPLVIAPFNVLMHLYTRADVEHALATVRAHLSKNGLFVFDVLVPWARALARDPTRWYKSRPITDPSTGTRYRYDEAFEYDPVAQVQLVTMRFEAIGSSRERFVMPLAHRQFFPAELEALLHYNGFEIDARYGDFDRAPLDGESESQIVLARPRSRKR